MKTKDLDIVYCLKEKVTHEEFRYSLRSLKNIEHNRVWVFGGCPDWLDLDKVEYVKTLQNKGNKWLNVASMLLEIAENDNVTEDFIWFNDDFFVLQKTDELNYYYDRTLSARISDFYKLHLYLMNNNYTRRLANANRALKWKKQTTLNYELHLPIIFNRKKLAEVIKAYPNVGAKRSLYGNNYVEDAIQRNDVKIYDNENTPDDTWDFVSTSDSSFVAGNVGKYIRQKFKAKSKYEKVDKKKSKRYNKTEKENE